MSEEATVTAPVEATPPDAGAETEAVKPPDNKAEIARLLKAEGVKLKAKDREVSVTSLEDLTSRAQRVFGMETLLEEAKREKAEAEKVKSWQARLDSEDDGAIEELSPKAQIALAKWYERKAAEYEKARELPPEVREERARAEDYKRRLAEYEAQEAQRKEAAEAEEYEAGVQTLRAELAKTAMAALKELKAEGAGVERLLPRVARVVRAAEAEGVSLSPEEIAAEVTSGMREEWGSFLSSFESDDALADYLGPDVAKRLMRVALKRRGMAAPPVAAAVRPATTKPVSDDDGLRGTPGFFRR